MGRLSVGLGRVLIATVFFIIASSCGADFSPPCGPMASPRAGMKRQGRQPHVKPAAGCLGVAQYYGDSALNYGLSVAAAIAITLEVEVKCTVTVIDTYRAVYTVKFAGVIYVLHAFQRKSKKGIATPQRDIDLIKARPKRAEEHYKENYVKGAKT